MLGSLLSQIAGLFDDGLSNPFGGRLSNLFGGGESEDGEGRLSSAAGFIRDSVKAVLRRSPIEEFVAEFARELVRRLLGRDSLDPDLLTDEEEGEGVENNTNKEEGED